MTISFLAVDATQGDLQACQSPEPSFLQLVPLPAVFPQISVHHNDC